MRFLKKATMLVFVCFLLISMTTVAFATGGQTEDLPENVTYTKVDELVFAITMVNVRSGPGTEYTRVDTLSFGESIQRVAVGSNGWSKVLHNGQICYMFSAYLSTDEASAITDTEELTRQIAIANGLQKAEYTKESFGVVEAALADAKNVLKGSSQETVDAAAKNLKEAIAALVRMNYISLEDALAAVERFSDGNDLVEDLIVAVAKGRELLGSGDQAAADAAAAEINRILTDLQNHLDELSTPQIITKEVQVEVPPSDDYCNIPIHRTWPILAIVSVILNVVFGTMIVVYLSQKRKRHRDDMPLVDYDISDDA